MLYGIFAALEHHKAMLEQHYIAFSRDRSLAEATWSLLDVATLSTFATNMAKWRTLVSQPTLSSGTMKSNWFLGSKSLRLQTRSEP